MDYPVVAVLTGDLNGCVMWRAQQPVAALQRRGYPVTHALFDNKAAVVQSTARADLVMIPRALFERPQTERGFFEWAGRNHAICYEADDDIWNPSPYLDGVLDDTKRREFPKVAHRARRAASKCDGIIVTNPFLAARARAIAKPAATVEVVPNLIDLEWWDALMPLTVRQDPDLTVGWIGGQRNHLDVAIMLEAWVTLAKKYPTLKFLSAGWEIPEIAAAMPADRYRYIQPAPIEQYPALYRQVDIGCCPVQDTLFNRCKSPIKVMEYAAAGAAVVASSTMYSDWFSPEDGVSFAVTAEDWVREISFLVENAALRLERRDRIMSAVRRRFSLADHCYKWIDAWIEVWEVGKRRMALQGVRRDASIRTLSVPGRRRNPEVPLPG